MIDFTSPSVRRAELIGASVLVLAVLGFTIWYMATHEAPQPYGAPEEETPVAEAVPPQVFEEHGEYYDIVATYPGEAGLAPTAGEAADADAVALMEDFVDETVRDFKRQGDFANLTPEDIQIMGLSDTRKESLRLEYESFSSPATLSFVFTMFADTLGAHPNTFYRTFTFDRASGEELKISDLFVANSGYLARLSAIAEFELAKSLGEFSNVEYIRQGVAPEDLNFQSFALDGTNLVLVFPPYQVAPYAAGTQQVTIPLSQLSEILKPAYRP